MKRKIILLLPLVMLMGCSQSLSTDKSVGKPAIEAKADSDKNKASTGLNKTEDNKDKEVNDTKELPNNDNKKSMPMDDEYIKRFTSKLIDEGFEKRDEEVKSDDTWQSMTKYVKSFQGGAHVIFVNKAESPDKIKGLENTTGYKGSTLIETNNSEITLFENKDERFSLLVAYDGKTGNGIIFMVNGSPKFEEVNKGLEYGKKLIEDLI